MIQLSVTEAQERFPDLLVAARAGEVVEIQENGCAFRLTAVSSRARPPATGVPKAGRLKGQLVVPDDFDEPLEQVCAALAKIPGSMVEDFRRERDERPVFAPENPTP